MVDQTTDGFNEALREAQEVVAVLAKLRARVDPMSAEHKLNDLVTIQEEAGRLLKEQEEYPLHSILYSEALSAFKLAVKDVKEFKAANFEQILKDRTA